MRKFPRISSLLINKFDGWIVGSAANPNVTEYRDLDIIIPFKEWSQAASLIPPNAKVNAFDGWKFLDVDEKLNMEIEVDVWPCNLEDMLKHQLFDFAWHYNTGTLIRKEIRHE